MDPDRTQLLESLETIRAMCDRLEAQINDISPPAKEWLTTADFAEQAGLSPRSVSVYCSNGKYARARKDSRGRWLIHRSELP